MNLFSYRIKRDGTLVLYKKSGVNDYCKHKGIERSRFNVPVEIDKDIDSCYELFMECGDFNQPVVIPEGVEDCHKMFMYCHELNSPITIPNTVKNTDKMFYGCRKFNQNVVIPPSVRSARNMFNECMEFRQNIDLPYGLRDCTGMFRCCRLPYESKFVIPNSVEVCDYMFSNIWHFEGEVILPVNANGTSCRGMFFGVHFLYLAKLNLFDTITDVREMINNKDYEHMIIANLHMSVYSAATINVKSLYPMVFIKNEYMVSNTRRAVPEEYSFTVMETPNTYVVVTENAKEFELDMLLIEMRRDCKEYTDEVLFVLYRYAKKHNMLNFVKEYEEFKNPSEDHDMLDMFEEFKRRKELGLPIIDDEPEPEPFNPMQNKMFDASSNSDILNELRGFANGVKPPQLPRKKKPQSDTGGETSLF